MSYKSPISIAFKEATTKLEQDIINNVCAVVMEYGIDVDKEELLKALKYDRGQYEIGYTDGYFAGKNSVVRCKDCKYYQANSCLNRQWDLESSTEIPTVRDCDFCSYGERKERG